jgi:hypothetical protein
LIFIRKSTAFSVSGLRTYELAANLRLSKPACLHDLNRISHHAKIDFDRITGSRKDFAND